MRAARDKGVPVKALDEKPRLRRELRRYWDAFRRLSNRRSFGFSGPQPISFGDCREYLDLHGISDPDEREEFDDYVSAMDAKYLEIHAEFAEERRKADAARSKRSRSAGGTGRVGRRSGGSRR